MANTITVAPFVDLSAFKASTGTIKATTKTALLTGISNIEALLTSEEGSLDIPPDFIRLEKAPALQVAAELAALRAAIIAHA